MTVIFVPIYTVQAEQKTPPESNLSPQLSEDILAAGKHTFCVC
jgi:hypothetical protein